MTACSSATGNSTASDPAASTAATTAASAPGSSSDAPSSSAPAAPADAANGLVKLQSAGLPIGATGTVTAENDPNHLLGRPGQYTSKVYWIDTSIDTNEVLDSSEGSVEAGGAIETFADAASAQKRADYIQSVTAGIPALIEYDEVVGPSVLRLSKVLTPDQVAKYKAALSS